MFNTRVLVVLLLSTNILGEVIDEFTTARQESYDTDSSEKQVEALNGLGYRLMTKYVDCNSNNIVMSPLGVTVLLSMALLGSTGRTYDELADILGFSRDILKNRNLHENLGSLLQTLSEPSNSKTMFAAAVFVDLHSELREKYLSYVGRVYGAGAEHVDFSDGRAATMAINDWVKVHTHDEIEHFLGEDLPRSTRVVLVNAVHFKAEWTKPFNPKYTTKMTFQTPEKEVTTDFMLNVGRFRYVLSREDGVHMVALPYKDNVTTMYALKPWLTHNLNITTVLKNLNYAKIDKLINRMEDEDCVIRFPKMNIEKDFNLEKYIKLEGAPTMFETGNANFALMVEDADNVTNKTVLDVMSRWGGADDDINFKQLKDLLDNLPNPGIHVDSIKQKVKINIDEYGTEAVASTAGIMARTAELFYADSPFLMFIRNEKTKLVIFSAVIFDPIDKIML
ncbi:serine protease inhibitor 28Dc-like [Plodia interpunctella]|uniref:serine protease inhibitor 28Dc-like n=1 Tax=Plodia interpunctella TaxID=58824 RepID=UPI002368351E|nr:serine protease inhibitor 28Dc-like [Plodia interpunctella]XP_053612220.1 serine protease inhibitor 28Dc-like [Plodia interpunctella]